MPISIISLLGAGVVLLAGILTGCSSPSSASLDEFVAWCQAQRQRPWLEMGGEGTYRESSVVLAAVIEAMESIVPLTEVADWHNKRIALVKSWKDLFDAQPGDEIGDDLSVIAPSLPLIEELGELEANMAPEVRELLEDADCLG